MKRIVGNKYKCPVCNYSKYKYIAYSEYGIGTVEQHGYCNRCGYIIEQAYSKPIDGFIPINKRGYKGYEGIYYENNKRKRKRMKRKCNIKYCNEDRWLLLI